MLNRFLLLHHRSITYSGVNLGDNKERDEKEVDFARRWSYHGQGLLLTGLPSLVCLVTLGTVVTVSTLMTSD